MMLAIDPHNEASVIRLGTIVDVLIIVGNMGPNITREQAQERMLAGIAMTYDSKETLLEAMLEISEHNLVHYIDSRDDRIFICNTIFGGAAYMMDCGDYRVFFHNEQQQLTPRPIADSRPGRSSLSQPDDQSKRLTIGRSLLQPPKD